MIASKGDSKGIKCFQCVCVCVCVCECMHAHLYTLKSIGLLKYMLCQKFLLTGVSAVDNNICCCCSIICCRCCSDNPGGRGGSNDGPCWAIPNKLATDTGMLCLIPDDTVPSGLACITW